GLFPCTPEPRWIYSADERQGDGNRWAGGDAFRLLVQHSSDLIVVVGRNGTVLYATPASEGILGCRPEEISGRQALSFVHWEDRARTHQALSRFLLKPDENLRLEVRVRHADGHLVDLEVHCRNLLEAPSIQGVVVNARDVTERKAVEEEVKRQLRQLNALRLVDASINAGRDIRETLAIVLDQAIGCLAVDAGAIHLCGDGQEGLSLVAARGSRLPAGEREAEEFVAAWAIPITVRGKRGALLELCHRSALSPPPAWFQFADMLAEQAAIAIGSSRLVAELERANQELESSYERTLEGWVRAVDLRDRETKGHTERVTRRTEKLAQRMGFAGERLAQIR